MVILQKYRISDDEVLKVFNYTSKSISNNLFDMLKGYRTPNFIELHEKYHVKSSRSIRAYTYKYI